MAAEAFHRPPRKFIVESLLGIIHIKKPKDCLEMSDSLLCMNLTESGGISDCSWSRFEMCNQTFSLPPSTKSITYHRQRPHPNKLPHTFIQWPIIITVLDSWLTSPDKIPQGGDHTWAWVQIELKLESRLSFNPAHTQEWIEAEVELHQRLRSRSNLGIDQVAGWEENKVKLEWRSTSPSLSRDETQATEEQELKLE